MATPVTAISAIVCRRTWSCRTIWMETSTTPRSRFSGGCAWQAAVEQEGSFSIGRMTPSVRTPSSWNVRVRSPGGSFSIGCPSAWHLKQASEVVSTFRPASSGIDE